MWKFPTKNHGFEWGIKKIRGMIFVGSCVIHRSSNNVLFVKIEGAGSWYTTYHHRNLLLKGFLQTPLLINGKRTSVHRSTSYLTGRAWASHAQRHPSCATARSAIPRSAFKSWEAVEKCWSFWWSAKGLGILRDTVSQNCTFSAQQIWVKGH